MMTDGGALPAWFSRTVAGLRAAGWLTATITTGQSFGGDYEAVTVHSGLLTAMGKLRIIRLIILIIGILVFVYVRSLRPH